jgi:hypothetical protein
LNCKADVVLTRDLDRKFTPSCPRCGEEIKLECANWQSEKCKKRLYSPKRWRFGKDGRPLNRFDDETCEMEFASKARGENKRRLREVMQRNEGKRATPVQLVDIGKDPAWEARNGILDCVVCREPECGWFSSGHSLTTHLSRCHDLSAKAYRLRHPGAPIESLIELSKAPFMRGQTAEELAKKRAEQYLTPERRDESRKEGLSFELRVKWLGVICRHCGEKLKDNLAASHLNQHGFTKSEYLALYPKAPLRSAKVIADGKRRNEERQRNAEAAGSLREEVKKLKIEVQGQPAIIRADRDALLPRFEKLFTLVDGGAWNLFGNRPIEDFAKDEIFAARDAVLKRTTKKNRARKATYILISGRRNMALETIRKYCDYQ